MSNYRRNYISGANYFFTIVTHQRRPILTTDLGRRCLRLAIETVRVRHPFTLFAVVLLPDHLHTVWMLPPGDSDYSLRWKRIKEEFTLLYLASGGAEGIRSESRVKQGERAIWQRRFWEHTIKDEDDLCRCADYVHWNPVKHGLVERVRDYPWSSFQRFVASGDYTEDWGSTQPNCDLPGAEWD